MLLRITKDYDTMSELAAGIVAERLRKNPALVLGLATGSTPLGTYRALIRMHQKDGLDFSRVTTFNLDEYIGLPAQHPQSYRRFMDENLFQHLNLDRRFTFIPDGRAADVEAHCDWYEAQIQEAGGIVSYTPDTGFNTQRRFGYVRDTFTSQAVMETLPGALAIGHVGVEPGGGGTVLVPVGRPSVDACAVVRRRCHAAVGFAPEADGVPHARMAPCASTSPWFALAVTDGRAGSWG